MPKKYTPEQSIAAFWARVDRPTDPTSCWVWQGYRNAHGYGKIGQRGRSSLAHRFAYEVANGPVPPGMCVCHTCDNRACCNPQHLYAGTHAQNMADMVKRGRAVAGTNPYPERIVRGEAVPQSKLTVEQVRALRQRRAEGATLAALATEFGISPSNAYYVASGKKWKHVT